MINGKLLRDAIISAANNIGNQRQMVDALNVFPVPDGDTGTNMSMTIGAAKREVSLLPDSVGVGEVAQTAASALLRGARGNSGVILSLLFRGFAKGLAGKKTAVAADMAGALAIGVDNAYKAVMKPTEGTMLTVARMAAEKAAKYEGDPEDVCAIWTVILDEAKAALEITPELLPVLKKAGVVDAGGKGLVCIFEGMDQVFKGIGMVEDNAKPAEGANASIHPDRNAAGEFEGEITFTYCTEFLVVKENTGADHLVLRAYLETIGDSVVVVDDEDIIKCHVHTDDPGKALSKAVTLGQLTNLKIENMREQHSNQQRSAGVQKQSSTPSYVPVDPDREYGFVAVAAGDGVQQLFSDLGADHVVSGGQTMNPSTDDILAAINATPAKTVFVLPNNKNIIMAAEQTIKLTDRKVLVLPTRSIPQGLSAMLTFDPDTKAEENFITMSRAAEHVGTGQITFAARDSDFDGHHIKEGELLAMENGKIAFTERDLTKAAVKLTRALLKKDSAFITLIYGEDVTAQQAEGIEAAIRQKLGASSNVEITTVSGGQPVYYLIISVE